MDEDQIPNNGSSSNIKAWYKGYSVLIHLTKSDMNNAEAYKMLAEAVIDKIASDPNWKPVWDKEEIPARQTSEFKTSSQRMVEHMEKTAANSGCPHDQGYKTLIAGPKSTRPGKQFKICNLCDQFIGWA